MSEELGQTVTLESIVAEAPVAPVPLSEEQLAYMVLTKNFKRFGDMVTSYTGSKKQLQQTWLNAAISPFTEEEFVWSYPEQKVLFDVFVELNYAKFILMLQGLEKGGKIKILQPVLSREIAPEGEKEKGESNE